MLQLHQHPEGEVEAGVRRDSARGSKPFIEELEDMRVLWFRAPFLICATGVQARLSPGGGLVLGKMVDRVRPEIR